MAFQEKRPIRIILVRHAESEGNVDRTKYCSIADSKIQLSSDGVEQAEKCGCEIRQLIEKTANKDWKVYFYVSPYTRTLSTLKGIGRAFERNRILGVREEPRLREQDFGNFQHAERMRVMKEIRNQFGRFFYRFPEGESGADVFDRVTSFLESLWRDIDMNRHNCEQSTDLNLIIVTHGVAMRIFLMRWFKWTTRQFELLNNPQNCEFRVMEIGKGGDYSLAVNHSRKEMDKWGFSEEMIADQEGRAEAKKGHGNDKWQWTGWGFFDHCEEESKSSNVDCYDKHCLENKTEVNEHNVCNND